MRHARRVLGAAAFWVWLGAGPTSVVFGCNEQDRTAPGADSRMTNADILKLVAAGLSESVIITSIRQAPIKDFDLTVTGLIALKKAHVSEGVIAAMQEKATPIASAPAPGSPAPRSGGTTVAEMDREIQAGREVTIKVKYNSVCPTCPGTNRLFAVTPYPAVIMAEGVVTLGKNSFTFGSSPGAYEFRVAPEKILELADEPERSSRVRVKIAVLNKKGTKEDKKEYFFYSLGAFGIGDPTVGNGGQSIVCSGCDDSMHTLFKLLSKIRESGVAVQAVR